MAIELPNFSLQPDPEHDRRYLEDRRIKDVGPLDGTEMRSGSERRKVFIGEAALDGSTIYTHSIGPENNPQLEEARRDVDEVFLNFPLAIQMEEIDSPVLVAEKPAPETQAALRAAGYEKKEKEVKFKLRAATAADIPAIVDVDMKSFDSVYSKYPQDSAQLRTELTNTFYGRYEKVGGEWMPVIERDGKIVGFMTCCPTNKTPDDFKSWEETTDNGTLNTTYDPNGKNVYVVTLSVLPEGTQGKDMLFAYQIGKMLREGYKQGFFESRMPGFKSWMKKTTRESGEDLEALSAEQKDAYADTYFNLKTTIGGKEVRKDRLLRLYERVGCKLLKVVPEAYNDDPSMNYGVVCVYDGEELFDGSVLPVRVPQNRITRWAFGALMQRTAKSTKLTTKLLG